LTPGCSAILYVAMGEPLGNEAWAVRLYHKPFVRWIWLGALVMAAGGLLAALDRRYRIKVKAVSVAMAPEHWSDEKVRCA
jgi:cytochrome c-type biogenesis protein CcmF